MVSVLELCSALSTQPLLVAFSCLSGDGTTQELKSDLGVMFQERRKKATVKLLSELRSVGYSGQLMVILDDCEPSRVWQWSTPQEEITAWCEMLVEDVKPSLPEGWGFKLWSELEWNSGLSYELILGEMEKPTHALLLHQQLEYMREFPNKKLVSDMRAAALRRLVEYALQGVLLERKYPQAILVQSETPWSVKDPLYSSLRKRPLPIIHPYPERR